MATVVSRYLQEMANSVTTFTTRWLCQHLWAWRMGQVKNTFMITWHQRFKFILKNTTLLLRYFFLEMISLTYTSILKRKIANAMNEKLITAKFQPGKLSNNTLFQFFYNTNESLTHPLQIVLGIVGIFIFTKSLIPSIVLDRLVGTIPLFTVNDKHIHKTTTWSLETNCLVTSITAILFAISVLQCPDLLETCL